MSRCHQRMAVGLMGASFLSLCAPCPGLGAEEAYGRACLVVEEVSSDNPLLITTTVLGKDSTPGPGKRVALYADSSIDASVLAVAFNDKDRRLTHGWRPQFVALRSGEEQRLPLAPVTWEWTSPTEPFDVYVGLARGFFYAGSRSIVASLWSVDDEATAYLMSEFYANLRSGSAVRDALRAAQRATRKRYSHPFYWAAFQVTGL